ncbi:ribokinase [Wukongibacter baidiensis]|uniref:ribokinase n=1 Tax=Wukongibacter baidiensis TaxID=1723361 RepID=UPI003D7F96FD
MITVIGSLNMDLVTRVKVMPRIGETLIGKNYMQIPGGKGANQADAIAKLGSKVKMIGLVGDDGFGNDLISSLTEDGVDVSHIKKLKDATTGIAVIMVNDEGENSIVVIPGANFELTPEHIDDSIEAIKGSDIVVTQLETPVDTVRYALKRAKELGKYTILNPAPAAKLDDELISYIDLLTPNETELEVLSGVKIETESDILAGARVLMNKGVKELIVTMGEKGALYVNDKENNVYPAHKVEPVDTTAAGDSFTGGIAVALSEGKSMEEAIKFATKVGAITVTREGAQSSLPTREEVERFK